METSNKLTGEQLSLWTSSVGDTHVNHLAQQDTEEAQKTQGTFGHTCEQPLANYDRNTRSWRTLEGISLWGDYKSLESLPKSGMTRNGVLYQQEDWVPAINVSGSSLWPTPTARDGKGASGHKSLARRMAHGVSKRMDKLRGLGNAVVPQVGEYIGRLITTSLDA